MVTERRHGLLEVEIQPMRRRHIPAILRIEGQVYPRPWSAGLFLSEIAQRSTRRYLVAKHRTKVVGYCGIMLLGDEAHITNVAVDPAFQRNKIATRLMLAMLDQARASACRAVTLEVRRSNTGAQDLYGTFGFEIVGVRRGYYVETNEDAFVMWAEGIWSADYERRLDEIRASLAGRTAEPDDGT